jgi:hypothetical protein
MTAWGTAPARGWFQICGTCGARLVFVENSRAGRTGAAQRRHMSAIEAHLAASFRCRDTGTFLGGEIAACRCERPMLIQRAEGLTCARCEGLVAPEVAAAAPSPRQRGRRLDGGSR